MTTGPVMDRGPGFQMNIALQHGRREASMRLIARVMSNSRSGASSRVLGAQVASRLCCAQQTMKRNGTMYASRRRHPHGLERQHRTRQRRAPVHVSGPRTEPGTRLTRRCIRASWGHIVGDIQIRIRPTMRDSPRQRCDHEPRHRRDPDIVSQ